MNTFITETDPLYVKRIWYKIIAISFVVMSLFACLGFLIAWQTFVFLEAIVIISVVSAVIPNKPIHHHYELRFEGNKLFITDHTAEKTYEIYDIPAEDIVIRQPKKDRQGDYCDVLIRNTIFILSGVKKCRELKAYIAENYESMSDEREA